MADQAETPGQHGELRKVFPSVQFVANVAIGAVVSIAAEREDFPSAQQRFHVKVRIMDAGRAPWFRVRDRIQSGMRD